MSQYQNMYKVELTSGTAPFVNLKQLYYGDIKANRLGAIVTLNGEPATLTGTCSGSAILADGTTVPMTGVISGNQAYIDLIGDCYSVEGQINLFVKITTGGVTTTLLAAVGTVKLTETDDVIDPGTIIPSVSALITAIENAVDSIPADYSALLSTIAPAFSDTNPYAAGEYVWRSGTLYRFTEAHAAGAWIGSDAVTVVIGSELEEKAEKAMIGPTEASTTASAAHPAGSYFILGGLLYKATADIAQGGSIVTSGTGANCQAATVGGEMAGLYSEAAEEIADMVPDEVAAWLDAHPEATTTVEDGAITQPKLADALWLSTKNAFVTPEQFGAVGDGTTDDTQAVRAALAAAISAKVPLMITQKHYLTAPLITAQDYAGGVKINIQGINPLDTYTYELSRYGGFKLALGISLFDGVNIEGSINRVMITAASRSTSQVTTVFNECDVNAFVFSHCTVSNMTAFFRNTEVSSCSKILFNRFITVYWFAKCDSESKDYKCTDSWIVGNYINGGAELDNNNCIEWMYLNGCYFGFNFVDYFRTIFYPKKLTSGTYVYQGPLSFSNHYQVFKYLYIVPSKASTFQFQSVGDGFNWNDPVNSADAGTRAKLQAYTAITYTGHDNQSYDIPPNIFTVSKLGIIRIMDAKIESNIGQIVFVKEGIGDYDFAVAELTVTPWSTVTYSNAVSIAEGGGVYRAGGYRENTIKLPNLQAFIKKGSSLPGLTSDWGNYFVGQIIRNTTDNHFYRLMNIYDTDESNGGANAGWVRQWVDVTTMM